MKRDTKQKLVRIWKNARVMLMIAAPAIILSWLSMVFIVPIDEFFGWGIIALISLMAILLAVGDEYDKWVE